MGVRRVAVETVTSPGVFDDLRWLLQKRKPFPEGWAIKPFLISWQKRSSIRWRNQVQDGGLQALDWRQESGRGRNGRRGYDLCRSRCFKRWHQKDISSIGGKAAPTPEICIKRRSPYPICFGDLLASCHRPWFITIWSKIRDYFLLRIIGRQQPLLW